MNKSKLYVPFRKTTIIEKSPKPVELKNDNDNIEKGNQEENGNKENNDDKDDNLTDLSNDEENKSQTDINLEKTKQKAKILTSDSPGFESLSLLDQLEILENESDFVELIKLQDGDSFGELALINNSPRMATIVWVTSWIFATMDKNDYNKTLSRIESRNINKVIDFFKNLPYFSNFSRTALTKMRFNFKKVKYKCNYVVYKEGDHSDFVYIVINGDFELFK